MANQKQRRRRAKEKRHQYDLVQIDEEGNETVLTATDVRSEAPEKTKPASRGSKASAPSRRGAPKPPTWGRVLKRAAIFAPIFLATVLLLGGDRITFPGALLQTSFLLAIFVPFSYLMDRLVWRSHEKRLAKTSTR